MDRRGITRHWRTALVAVAIIAASAGGAGARAVYDANNARHLGGYTHAQMATQFIAPQAASVTDGATMGRDGPVLSGTSGGTMTVGTVVPPDHQPGTPYKMRVTFREGGNNACAWVANAEGLEGPDGPNTSSNIHNGGWKVPGTNDYTGPVAVPAGSGEVFSGTFSWPFDAKPGMFIQFQLSRYGGDAADTCSDIQVVGLRLSY